MCFCRYQAVAAVVFLVLLHSSASGDASTVVPASEAKHHVDQEVTVEMEVRATGRSRKDNLLFLNTHENYRSNENFAVVMTPEAQKAFATGGITDPEKHYFRKVIRVTGKIRHFKSITDMHVDKPTQIKVVRVMDEKPNSVENIPQTMEDPVIATSPLYYVALGALGAGVVIFGASRILAYRKRRKEEVSAA